MIAMFFLMIPLFFILLKHMHTPKINYNSTSHLKHSTEKNFNIENVTTENIFLTSSKLNNHTTSIIEPFPDYIGNKKLTELQRIIDKVLLENLFIFIDADLYQIRFTVDILNSKSDKYILKADEIINDIKNKIVSSPLKKRQVLEFLLKFKYKNNKLSNNSDTILTSTQMQRINETLNLYDEAIIYNKKIVPVLIFRKRKEIEKAFYDVGFIELK